MNTLLLSAAWMFGNAPPVPIEQAAPIESPAAQVQENPAVPPAQTPPPTPPPEEPLSETDQRGDIVVVGRGGWEAPDPLRGANAASFGATQAVDTAIVGPVARAYKSVVPKPVRDGAHNFLYNLREPVVAVNFLLQLKIGKALETVGRFGVNTTVGVAGVFDMAKRRPFKLPRRGNGFADTLGFYGVKPGPFLFLPIVGPTTVRDLFGGAIDRALLPVVFGSRVTRPEVAIPFAVIGALDHRSEFDDTLKILHDGQADPYARSRDFYLQRRQAEIDGLRGRASPNSTPMSIAPTAPFTVKERAPATTIEPAPKPEPAAPPQ